MSTQIRLGQITTTGAATNDIVKYNGTAYVPATNAPVFANITSKPTTLSGYGITDAQGLDAGLTSLAGLTGAGIVSATGTDTFAMISSIPATQGGTGQTTYAVGDILVGGTTNTLNKLADVATGNVLMSGGVGVAPSYGKVNLSTHVTALTASRAAVTNASGFVTAATTTSTEIGYVNGVTSAIQTQLNGKFTNSISTARMLGRTTASTGAIEEITVGAGLSLSAGSLTNKDSFDVAFTGTQNGSNVTFTITPTIIANSERVHRSGVRLKRGAGNDYTISGSVITFAVAPISTDNIIIDAWV